jgi:hypothetical protein
MAAGAWYSKAVHIIVNKKKRERKPVLVGFFLSPLLFHLDP